MGWMAQPAFASLDGLSATAALAHGTLLQMHSPGFQQVCDEAFQLSLTCLSPLHMADFWTPQAY